MDFVVLLLQVSIISWTYDIQIMVYVCVRFKLGWPHAQTTNQTISLPWAWKYLILVSRYLLLDGSSSSYNEYRRYRVGHYCTIGPYTDLWDKKASSILTYRG